MSLPIWRARSEYAIATRRIVCAIGIASVVGVASAQTPANRSFEVASIKPNKSGTNRINFEPMPGGRFAATNASVMDMIVIAYATTDPFPRSQILGAPGWANVDRFDVVAKAAGNPTRAEYSLMLRSLLADRFGLRMHTETRERPIYALVLAARDRRLGPALRRSEVDCQERQNANGPPRDSQAGVTCRLENLPGKLTATSIPMETLAHILVGHVADHREIHDETGLTGKFSVTLQWTPDRTPAQPPPDAPPEVARAIEAIDPNGVSLFTAVQEQLGLKLESRKGQAEILIIDRVDHPTED